MAWARTNRERAAQTVTVDDDGGVALLRLMVTLPMAAQSGGGDMRALVDRACRAKAAGIDGVIVTDQ